MQRLVVLLKTMFMAACAIAIFGPITWQLRHQDPLIPVTLPPWMAVGGIVLIAAGAVLAFVCFDRDLRGRAEAGAAVRGELPRIQAQN